MSEVTKEKPQKKKTDVVHLSEESSLVVKSQSPDSMIFMALEKGLDITIIERLMQMRNDELKRVARIEYLNAMAKFQSILPNLQKNKKVDYTSKSTGVTVKYNYQDLGSIIDMIREPLEKCGLFYRWEQSEKDSIVSVACVVSHIAGHEERGIPLTGALDTSGNKSGLHAKASTITYLQRYTLKGILGLASTETDDDGIKGNKKETVSDLPKLEGSQVTAAINLVKEGKETMETLASKWSLTEGQVNAIKKATQTQNAN